MSKALTGGGGSLIAGNFGEGYGATAVALRLWRFVVSRSSPYEFIRRRIDTSFPNVEPSSLLRNTRPSLVVGDNQNGSRVVRSPGCECLWWGFKPCKSNYIVTENINHNSLHDLSTLSPTLRRWLPVIGRPVYVARGYRGFGVRIDCYNYVVSLTCVDMASLHLRM